MSKSQTSFFLLFSIDGTAGRKCSSHLFHYLFLRRPRQLAPSSRPPPATPDMCCLPFCTSAQGLELRALGGGCFQLRWEGICNLFATYQSLAVVKTYLFEINIFIHLSKYLQPYITWANVVVLQMPSLWVRPSWGYHTHFVDSVAKGQRGNVTCPETHSW